MSILLACAIMLQPLADPDKEARARALEQEIRCVACENEPISQSGAEIALDMRRELRERIENGESDEQIRRSFKERYGDFVLLRPPMDARTWALWGAPLALILAGGLLAFGVYRRRGPAECVEMPEEADR